MEMKFELSAMNFLDEDVVKKAYGILESKSAGNDFCIGLDLTEDEEQIIKKVLGVYELSLTDLWNYAFDATAEQTEKRDNFHAVCFEYFKLMRLLRLPENKEQKIRHVLKLVSSAFLGSRWQEMRKILAQNNDFFIDVKDDLDLETKILALIHNTVISLVRKDSWSDLQIAMDSVAKLKNELAKFDENFFSEIEVQNNDLEAHSIIGLFHLAKSVELVANFVVQGSPDDVIARMDMHFEKAVSHFQNCSQDSGAMLRMLQLSFKRMVFGSMWVVAKNSESKITRFMELMEHSDKELYEFLQPQQVTMIENKLLDPSSKAIVVTLPNSNGKILLAELKILQALNHFIEIGGWIAYAIPGKELEKQTISKLKKDFAELPLEIRIDKLSNPMEVAIFEGNVPNENSFDVLVTTTDKLSILIKGEVEKKLGKPLVLIIVDEAFDSKDEAKIIEFEELLSTIQKKCKNSHLLFVNSLHY